MLFTKQYTLSATCTVQIGAAYVGNRTRTSEHEATALPMLAYAVTQGKIGKCLLYVCESQMISIPLVS